ncbi:MAG TPA: 2-C-methyl-D-erythritol 2,4-cyclodiphosphate synthase [Gemmatimonadaceae bacterium]|nr:2-C-methyl-D-erythritol 2,4-cyclodiphosphate synthase [Gemmatimonadaceae bacterium]
MADGATGGGGQPAPRMYARTGIGYDSHRFEQGGPIVLGGVRIPSDFHLAGHSDGDAIAHALTDAILGAAAAGDIGSMFPDTDPQNAGRDSIGMLAAARNVVIARGWIVIAADITVIAERPRISAHRDEMCRALANALGVVPDAISIKGKTNEGMGWIGRGEGLACIAVATIAPLEGPTL